MNHQLLLESLPYVLNDITLPCNQHGFNQQSGKVREMCVRENERIIITTDRVSAFDVVLGTIPMKGQVLTQLSAWWFSQTKDIIPNHLLLNPDPNVMVVENAKPLPIEVIVRGYITGVTKTSLWKLYEAGERQPYGIKLPDGLKKNDQLPHAIITPTTKAEAGGHDERLTSEEIIEQEILPEALWQQIEHTALALFKYGQELAHRAGLLLVDTKYEFGLVNDQLTLIDEIHTPDSSRYWIAESYKHNPENPESIDKEYLREWFASQGYRGEGDIPPMPDEFRVQVAERYISVYETLTGQTFVPGSVPIRRRILDVVEKL
ncbi:MAG: phosphoribosylaminoimidazolesuccinocarboxamide synthase [Trueperaceae bacterium]